MPLPDVLISIPPLASLSESLRLRTNKLRSEIIRANYNTQFVQTAQELTEFRHATSGFVDEADDDILSQSFRKTVHFTTYDSYAPFLARFFTKPCKASSVVDLFAPGLPDYLSGSSSTSGGLPKFFPKYNYLSKTRSSDARSWTTSDPPRRRTKAYIFYLGYDRMAVEDDINCSVTTIYLACVAIVGHRMQMHLDPEKDEEKMGTFILDHAAPYATGFIKKWHSFLLIHALFALGNRSLETMVMLFINTFVDTIRYIDMEFDMLVDCIANGTIPDLDGIAEVRHYLEVNIFPDPERAAELRRLGRPSSRPGWCGQVWPSLRSVTAISSGSFATSVPLARWFLGPNAEIHAHVYACSEVLIGRAYNPVELNQFKPNNEIIIEFLDIHKSDSIDSLAQIWEVELGGQYELVLTTRDGLWRYRLGDVIEISGFDPTDGAPIIQFIERRNIAIRLPDTMVTEQELRAAVSSMASTTPVNVVNWTTMVDDRCVPATIGFFIELAGNHGTYGFRTLTTFSSLTNRAYSLWVIRIGYIPVFDLALAPERALEQLSRSNENIAWALAHDLFRKPTVRLVRPGTFSDFLQLKLDEGSNTNSVGQVKVPIVLPKAEYVAWFSNRVVQEL